MNQTYSDAFYKAIREGSISSARQIVPLVLDLVHPASVVDVGCGTGSWLSVFKEHGVGDILGMDGEYVGGVLEIDAGAFRATDLTRPFEIGRRFDLVVCLEVVEHLPAESARQFIDSLVKLGPVILFSAAIPHQGGWAHQNEQWPDYWSALFESCGFVPVDCLRKKLWNNAAVEFWYRQNILIYVDRKELHRYLALERESAAGQPAQLSLVHPELFVYRQSELRRELESKVSRLESELAATRREKEAELAAARETIKENEAELASRARALEDYKTYSLELEHQLEEMRASRGWQILLACREAAGSLARFSPGKLLALPWRIVRILMHPPMH